MATSLAVFGKKLNGDAYVSRAVRRENRPAHGSVAAPISSPRWKTTASPSVVARSTCVAIKVISMHEILISFTPKSKPHNHHERRPLRERRASTRPRANLTRRDALNRDDDVAEEDELSPSKTYSTTPTTSELDDDGNVVNAETGEIEAAPADADLGPQDNARERSARADRTATRYT